MLVLAGLLMSCGGSPAASPAPTIVPSSPVPSATAAPAPSATAAPAKTKPVQVFFSSAGKLVPETAQVSAETPAKGALEALLQGPKEAGHFSDIPKGTQLRGLSIDGSTATVDFDQAFFASGGASGVMLRLAEVVYTLTQLPGVTAVQLLKEGQQPGVIGEGFPLNRPLGRAQFATVAP